MKPLSLGIDIAKKKFDAALLINGKFRDQQFNNNEEGFAKLTKWLNKHSATQVRVCLEATGIYAQALTHFLYQQGYQVGLINPVRISDYAKSKLSRNKTDKLDAHIIADFCDSQEFEVWTPPAPETLQLQALVRHRDDLQELRQQQLNRIEGSVDQAVKASLTKMITFIDEQIEQIEQQIIELLADHSQLKKNKELLLTIPGIGVKTAHKILAELPDVAVFDSVRQAAAYAGLSPRKHDSGTSVHKKPRLSKIGSHHLRKALFFPALVAKQHNPLVNAFCQRLLDKGKHKFLVVGAAMRKLLHIIFGVLKSQRPFDANFSHNLA
jgi:transposase